MKQDPRVCKNKYNKDNDAQQSPSVFSAGLQQQSSGMTWDHGCMES